MKIQNVHFHFGPPAIGAAVLATLFAGPSGKPVQTSKTPPAIGEYWEGEGGIYAGMGRGRDGGRDYALIVPTDPRAIFKKRALGTYDVDVQNASSPHDGPTNTASLAAAGSELCKEILALDIDGHKDFYLMSRTDAQLCWANVPELFAPEWHLTSTQYSRNGAWNQYFGNGDTDYSYETFEASARACRRLFL